MNSNRGPHACKHWIQAKRATVAKNTVSGLVLVAKSCDNDVSRLTFWLLNTIVLREIISQVLGNSCQSSSLLRLAESNGNGQRNDRKYTALKWKGGSNSKRQENGFMRLPVDWQDTATFTPFSLYSNMFSRIVESVWGQALTPYMQSPTGGLPGPARGEQKQGNFFINLWRNAFLRLCPVRARGHECGCLPVLDRMFMKQCIARLDVAMFNTILRESAHEIPIDLLSDPIVNSKVLAIPARDLSIISGTQLKNSVGTWSRWLTHMYGMDAEDCLQEDQENSEEDGEAKSFAFLYDLSDLLMLPKNMLMDRLARQEVCPFISLPLLKRINFNPGDGLEALNAEV